MFPLLSGRKFVAGDKRHSLAVRMLAIVFGFYLLVTISLTIIHLYSEYNHAREGVLDGLQVIQETFGPALATALWDLNLEQLKPTFLGMADFPSIVGVKVVDETGGVIGVTGQVPDDDDLQETKRDGWYSIIGSRDRIYQNREPIIYDFRGDRIVLGSAVLYSSPGVVFDKVKLSLYFIIANALIKTIAFWIIFIIIANRMLMRPLRSISEAANSIHLDQLESYRFDVGVRGENELSDLTDAFNTLVERVDSMQQELRNTNSHLEAKVLERTIELEKAMKDIDSLSRKEGAREERKRIMRDLHDDVGGHLLTLIHTVEKPYEEQLVRKAFNALRETINILDDDLEYHLYDVLDDWRIDSESRLVTCGTRLSIDACEGDIGDVILLPRYAINIRRVLDESVTNVIKHARANWMRIMVRHDDDLLSIQVLNDCPKLVGDAVPSKEISQGRGCLNMRNRLSELGGQFECGMVVVNGEQCFQIVFSFPLPQISRQEL